MTNYSQGTRKVSKTSQSKPIPGRESDMAQNNAGGYSFTLDKWSVLNRFLILGVETPTYYSSAQDLIKLNTINLDACIKEDASRVLKTILEISITGRASKQDPTIFALAKIFNSANNKAKREAEEVFSQICRTGTHLFMFSYYLNEMRGWGRAVRKAVSNWYNMDVNRLEYQITKYQGRSVEKSNNKFTHKDVLRLGHIKPASEMHNEVFRYIIKDEIPEHSDYIKAVEKLKGITNVKNINEAIKLIEEYRLPQEVWPNELKNEKMLWRSALKDMPLTAMIRNLGKMSSIDVFDKSNIDLVISKLTDQEYIRKSRVHPMTILTALMTYMQGHGLKGSLSWNVHKDIAYSLDKAFYLAFGNVTPTGKRTLLALDVSGSMGSPMNQNSVLTCRDASAAMALITANVEEDYEIVGFQRSLTKLNITPDQTLKDAIKVVSGLPFGGTDCSLPMLWALESGKKFDAFVVYTDNETWAGRTHPSQALKQYRNKTKINARLAVVAMTPTNFSIADPKDGGMLDVVGFDTATPEILSSFIRGEI